MEPIEISYINALLADATCALTTDGLEGMGGTRCEDLPSKWMMPILAKYVADNFEIASHFEAFVCAA